MIDNRVLYLRWYKKKFATFQFHAQEKQVKWRCFFFLFLSSLYPNIMSLVSRCSSVYPYSWSQIKKKKSSINRLFFFFYPIFLCRCTRTVYSFHFARVRPLPRFRSLWVYGLSRLFRACGWLICKESSFSLESCSFFGYENLRSPRSFQTSSDRDLRKFTFLVSSEKFCSSLSECGWIEKCLHRVY